MTQRFPLSVSRRRDLTECPLKFRLLHDPFKEGKQLQFPVAILDYGATVHALIQRYILYLVDKRETSAPAAVDHIWQGYLRETTEPVPDPVGKDALACFRKFTGRFQLDVERVWQPEAELAVDQEGQPCGWFDARVFLRAKLDLTLVAGDHAEVRDWKAGWKTETEDEMRNDPQSVTYPMMLRAVNDILERFTVVFDYVRFGIERTVEWAVSDCNAAWKEWLAVSDRLQTMLASPTNRKTWAPSPGPWCATCSVASACPLGKDLTKAGVIQGPQDATMALERLLVLDAVRASLVEQMKAWASANGPVDVNGKVAGFWKKDGSEYDISQAFDLARKHEVAWTRFLAVNNQALKKTVKEFPEFGEAMAAIRKDKSTTEFRVKNAKEEE